MDASSVQTCKRCGERNENNAPRCKACGNILEIKEPVIEEPVEASPKKGHNSTIILEEPPGKATEPPVLPYLPSRYYRLTRRRFWLALVFVLLLLSILGGIFLPRLITPRLQTTHPGTTPVPTGIGRDGIGVSLVNQEYIGISDGRYALDTNRSDGKLKEAAAASLRAGDTAQANAQWNAALQIDTNDAEALIYLEDQRVLDSGDPYITLVVGTLLNSGDTYSRDILQGAYVKQEECNAPSNPCGVKIRLLIAKSGGDATRSKDIATQIVQAAHFDRTIVGVLGWPTTKSSLIAVQVLAQAHIPMIAATAAGDNLTGISSYFFRVTATSSTQVHLLTQYIEVKLKPQRVVVFEDQNEPYSQGLAAAFITEYVTHDQHQIVGNQAVPFQTGGKAETLTQTVQNILQTDHPDVIFFTSINVNDMTTLLNAIPDRPEFANVKVVMGGSGYSLVESGEKFAGYDRIRFAATAFPDSWRALGRAKQNPVFFQDYPNAFDPNGTHVSSPYTFDRPTSYTMLGYDATSTFLKAYQILQQNKQTLTPENIRQALTEITGSMALQGITGIISFDTNGDAANKAAFILRVDVSNRLQADAYQGCYFIGSPCSNTMTLI